MHSKIFLCSPGFDLCPATTIPTKWKLHFGQGLVLLSANAANSSFYSCLQRHNQKFTLRLPLVHLSHTFTCPTLEIRDMRQMGGGEKMAIHTNT